MPLSEPSERSLFTRLAAAVVARRGVLTCLAVLACLGLGAQLAWRHFAPQLRADPRYAVTPDNVLINEPPGWVRERVVAAAFADAGLAGTLSMLDPAGEVEKRLGSALEARPWVRTVDRIQRVPPNRVRIELTYRAPLAAVRLADGTLLPIDGDGVVLPENDVPAARLRLLPRSMAFLQESRPPGFEWAGHGPISASPRRPR